MPWREMSPVDVRVQFISEYLSDLFSMTELAAQYGISRKTAYKWVTRYEAAGPGALADRSRRPHEHPAATAPALIAALLRARARHPSWGARKLLAMSRRQQPAVVWPSRSTVCDLLRRAGLIVPRRQRGAGPHGGPPLQPIVGPNGTWTTDFKGEFRTGDARYCYPLTLRDGFSRYVLRCDALLGRTTADTRRCFARAFAAYGLPDRIRSDNGLPFAGPGLGRLSRLNVWWLRLGIVPERIALGRPDQNGSHEQFHRVLKAETTRPPAATARAQQRRFQTFCHEYNTVRPHEALGDQPPASWYQPSRRALPPRLPALEYPGHWEVRRVATNGCIAWRGAPLFLTDVLEGDQVGCEEVAEGVWTLYFGAIPLGRIDDRTRRVTALPATRVRP
jgi:putative transposase